MQKYKVGIIGFGNLGKEVAKQLDANEKFELVGIFSRRKLNGCYSYDDIKNFINKIDLMFLCVGSQNDLEKVAYEQIKNFNTIDCYDNHNRLKNYIKKQNDLAIRYSKVALCAFGWDPGLFSLMRGLIDSLDFKYYTFWGKGLSQGHTQALKNLPNVIDAVQFTVPSKNALKSVKNGNLIENDKSLHKRMCFIVCAPEHERKIKSQIVSMPDYFEGYRTIVKFVSSEELNKIKSFAHKGEVVACGDVMEFKLNLKSNPEFTAKVLIDYAKAVFPLVASKRFGAYTILDLPINAIIEKEKFHYI